MLLPDVSVRLAWEDFQGKSQPVHECPTSPPPLHGCDLSGRSSVWNRRELELSVGGGAGQWPRVSIGTAPPAAAARWAWPAREGQYGSSALSSPEISVTKGPLSFPQEGLVRLPA